MLIVGIKKRLRLSPVWPWIMAANPSDGVMVDIDPSFLGWPVELFQGFAQKQPVKCGTINKTITFVLILYMKKHIIRSSACNLYSLSLKQPIIDVKTWMPRVLHTIQAQCVSLNSQELLVCWVLNNHHQPPWRDHDRHRPTFSQMAGRTAGSSCLQGANQGYELQHLHRWNLYIAHEEAFRSFLCM